MRAEGGRLIVDQDGPIRVARGHSAQFYVAGKYPERMELIVAPVAELKARITHVFEEIVSETLDRGTGTAAEAHGFTCGITGGSTALIFLGALRDADVAWSRVTLFWGDERAVPPESPESNYGLAEQMLLTPLGAKAPQAIRMPGEAPDLERAAREYSAALPPALDLLILGVGDDGHVCSLFPGHPALLEASARVLAITDSPKPPPRRLTLTMAYVLRCRRVWIVAVGERKRVLLQQAIQKQQPATPFDLVVAQGQQVTIFTDQTLSRSPGSGIRG
jgi:6-phosphogluconolactonase